MKKVLSILLVCVMCLGLTACGDSPADHAQTTGDSERNDAENTIELTTENCETYLEISVSKNEYGDGFRAYNEAQRVEIGYFYEGVQFELDVKGASSNYNYNDVVVTVTISGEYSGLHKNWKNNASNALLDSTPFEVELRATANVAGNGTERYVFRAPSPYYTNEDFVYSTYEITDVSGTVTPI